MSPSVFIVGIDECRRIKLFIKKFFAALSADHHLSIDFNVFSAYIIDLFPSNYLGFNFSSTYFAIIHHYHHLLCLTIIILMET